MLRYPIEVLKKYKGNLKNFDDTDKKKLSWVAQATVSVVLYMRALRDARNTPERSEGHKELGDELTRRSYHAQNQISGFWGAEWVRNDQGETVKVEDAPEVLVQKHDTYAKLLRDDPSFMDTWVDYEVRYAVQFSFLLETIEGPKLAVKDAQRLISLDDAAEVLKEATEETKKRNLSMDLRVAGLDSPEGLDLIRSVKDMRDWTLHNETDRVIHNLRKEVPVTLVWQTAKKGSK